MSDVEDWSKAAECAAQYVTARTGLAFAPHRQSQLLRGLRRVTDEAEYASDPERVVQRLDSDPESWERLLEEITVGETYFFREPEHFEFVRHQVLPGIFAERGPQPALRVWSAGCASGEELYSIAIVLQQHGLLSRASLLGTDISRQALARAREGLYRSWSLRGVNPSALASHFIVEPGGFRVHDELRESVRFEKLNLAQRLFPSPVNGTASLDLIFCRNVFIYLNAETIRHVCEGFLRALAPGGYLLLGSSDPLLSDAGFELVTTSGGIVYRKPAERDADAGFRSWVPPRPSNSKQSAAPAAPRPQLRPVPNEPAAPTGSSPSQATNLRAQEIRELANRSGAALAERSCMQALEHSPLSVELHYLHGVLLLELADYEGAASALRRALYLDPDLAIAHFTLGSLLSKRGDAGGAARAFRNARQCARKAPSETPLPLSDGLLAGGVARAAERELELLASTRSRT